MNIEIKNIGHHLERMIEVHVSDGDNRISSGVISSEEAKAIAENMLLVAAELLEHTLKNDLDAKNVFEIAERI